MRLDGSDSLNISMSYLLFILLTDYNICEYTPCLNGGICEDLGDENYDCQCPNNIIGNNCEFGKLHDILIQNTCKILIKYFPVNLRTDSEMVFFKLNFMGFQTPGKGLALRRVPTVSLTRP